MSSDTTTTSRDFLAHYRPIAEQVERYAWYLTRSTDDAAELTQATIVEVLHGWDRIRDAAALHAYCLSVMTRLHVRERVRRRRTTSMEIEDITQVMSTDARGDQLADVRIVLAAIDALAEPLRTTATLRFLMDLPHAEIADIMHTSVAAVKMRVLRARSVLRRALQAPYERLHEDEGHVNPTR